MPYLREIMIAGPVIEVREYQSPRYGQKGQKRSMHVKPSPIPVQVINHRNSERKLRGLLYCNFKTNDWLVTLTYKQGTRVDEATARKDVQKMLRKLKRHYMAAGMELKYIYVIELLARSAHIHMVINYIDPSIVRKCWMEAIGWEDVPEYNTGNIIYDYPGGTHFEPLWAGDFATRLASYLLKEFDPKRELVNEEGDSDNKKGNSDNKKRRKPTGAKFHSSRNLAKPEIRKEIMKRTKIPKNPYIKKGYILLPNTYHEGVCAFTGYEYRSYSMIRGEAPPQNEMPKSRQKKKSKSKNAP